MQPDSILPLLVFLCLALLITTIYDLKYKKIPNLITFPLAIVGVFYHSIFFGLDGLLFSSAGLFLGIGLFLPVYVFGGMGAGDVKLMGAAGAVLGAKGVFIAALLTALFGGLYALLLLAIHHRYARAFISRTWAVLKTFALTRQYIPVASPHPVQNRPRLCYGVAIAMGVFTYLILEFLDYQI